MGNEVRQRVLGALGRFDVLQASGQLDGLLASCARFAQHSAVLSAARANRLEPLERTRIGPPLVFQRLWEQLGLPSLLGELLADRRFEFEVERAVKEVSEVVLGRGGRYQEVFGRRQKSKDPAPLKVKEVWVEDRRYIVCLNEEQAEVDRANREAILKSLADRLTRRARRVGVGRVVGCRLSR